MAKHDYTHKDLEDELNGVDSKKKEDTSDVPADDNAIDALLEAADSEDTDSDPESLPTVTPPVVETLPAGEEAPLPTLDLPAAAKPHENHHRDNDRKDTERRRRDLDRKIKRFNADDDEEEEDEVAEELRDLDIFRDEEKSGKNSIRTFLDSEGIDDISDSVADSLIEDYDDE